MTAADCRIIVRVFSGRGHRGGGPSAPPPPAQPANCRGEAKTVAPFSRWLPPFKARPLQPRLCGFFSARKKIGISRCARWPFRGTMGKGPALSKKEKALAIRHRRNGKSYRAIAEALGRSVAAAHGAIAGGSGKKPPGRPATYTVRTKKAFARHVERAQVASRGR